MQSETQEAPNLPGAAEDHDGHKNDLITTDDGLDQAIQRAIAQHDLEQQQLEQQQQLHSAGNAMEIDENGQEDHVNEKGHAILPQGSGTTHTEAQQLGPDSIGNNIDHEMAKSPLLDAAQEKQHLQMIADELKRAATEGPPDELDLETHEEADHGARIEGHGKAELSTETGAAAAQGHATNVMPDVRETGVLTEMNPALSASISAKIPPRFENRSQQQLPQARVAENNSEGQGGPGGREGKDGQNGPDGPNGQDGPNGPDGTATVTTAGTTSAMNSATIPHAVDMAATHIPANSELLAANEAMAAYNALSSQSRTTALLTNAHLAALPLPIVPTSYMPARIQLLVSTLAVLDNLATQLLRVFAVGPYQKIIDLASSPDTAPGAAFRDLTSLFEFTKRLYSEEDPFLTVEHLAPGIWKEGEKTPSMFRSREQTIESSLRKVNLATFLAATLGTIEVGFFHLNESFLHVFCPANDLDPANSMSNMSASNMNLQSGAGFNLGERVGKIFKPQASLYLDLKTQAYISAIEAGERSREEILEDIFPSNLEDILQGRRGTKLLSSTEMDFVKRCHARKEALFSYPEEENLNEQYEWFEFLKDLFEFVSRNMGVLLWGKKGKPALVRSSKSISTDYPPVSGIAHDVFPNMESATPHSDEILQDVPERFPPSEDIPSTTRPQNKGLDDITSALLPSEIQEQQIHLRINPSVNLKGPNRRPWTRAEERALRHAMELKGTQWSVILELFGQGGRINESLKNRTQVQLKDKARNWKMFFLKSGLAVPNYLQKVTGDIDRDDKLRAKVARNKKTAAAPVPTVKAKKTSTSGEKTVDVEEDETRKKRRIDYGEDTEETAG